MHASDHTAQLGLSGDLPLKRAQEILISKLKVRGREGAWGEVEGGEGKDREGGGKGERVTKKRGGPAPAPA